MIMNLFIMFGSLWFVLFLFFLCAGLQAKPTDVQYTPRQRKQCRPKKVLLPQERVIQVSQPAPFVNVVILPEDEFCPF